MDTERGTTDAEQEATDEAPRREWTLILALSALILLGAIVRQLRDRARPVPGVVVAAEQAAFRLDVNAASVDELRVLPGIGEARAKAAIAARENNGPFTSVESFARAAGLPTGMWDDIRDLVVFGGVESEPEAQTEEHE